MFLKYFNRIKPLKRPLWLSRPNMEEIIADNFTLDVVEMYKIDANTDEIFRKQYK
jgi:hypothetical protein